ncbi:SAP domain-containing protein [Aphis craccivora]|uniref:SAP domain-containing protein n=1 Tax=Aphis craccivora TaxID=307492 RepID=A0A6G0W275_APHCR|nr:SAP domain-containing protein [Aphis craccivora]
METIRYKENNIYHQRLARKYCVVYLMLTRYATAASTKYRHRSDRSATLSTASTDDDDTILSTLPPTPQRLDGTGRQVAPNEYRPPVIALSYVNRRTAYTKKFDNSPKEKRYNHTGEPRSPAPSPPSSPCQCLVIGLIS